MGSKFQDGTEKDDIILKGSLESYNFNTPLFTFFYKYWQDTYFVINGDGSLQIFKDQKSYDKKAKPQKFKLKDLLQIPSKDNEHAYGYSIQILDKLGNMIAWIRFKQQEEAFTLWRDQLRHMGLEIADDQKQQSENNLQHEMDNSDGTMQGQRSMEVNTSSSSNSDNESTNTEKQKSGNKPKPVGHAQGSTPMHRECQKSFISESQNKSLTNNPGLVNLSVVIFMSYNGRLMLENFAKYGFRNNFYLQIRDMFLLNSSNYFFQTSFIVMLLHFYVALIIEKAAAWGSNIIKKDADGKKKKGMNTPDVQEYARQRYNYMELIYLVLVSLNMLILVQVPSYYNKRCELDFLSRGTLITLVVVEVLKILSFHHCNFSLRSYRRLDIFQLGEKGNRFLKINSDQGKELNWPDNLTFLDISKYIFVPTLVYQTAFPMNKTRSASRMIKLGIALQFIFGFMAFLTAQFMEPTMNNTIIKQAQLQGEFDKMFASLSWYNMERIKYQAYYWTYLFGRLLKLFLPTVYWWLAMFIAVFHVWLNLLAEVTMFGDREFYKDWWNATTIGEYWRLWNIPIHKWMLRTVYYPLVRYGAGRVWGSFVVFTISAIVHEIVIGFTLNYDYNLTNQPFAFYVMMAQIPAAYFTETIKQKYKTDMVGNYLFWLLFCLLGQPICIMLYYQNYLRQNNPDSYTKGLEQIEQKFQKGSTISI